MTPTDCTFVNGMRPLYLLFPVYDVLSPSHKGVFEGSCVSSSFQKSVFEEVGMC